MNLMNLARRLVAATVPLALAIAPLAAGAQAKATPDAAKSPGCSANLKGSAPMKVKLTTSMGAITVELNKEKAPVSAENFAKYVDSGHYNGTIFHRVIDGFMIQGGGFNEHLIQNVTREPVENEASNGLSNLTGTIAMARTTQPHSATAQFFINVSDNRFLDHPGQDGWGYCVFGKVTAGMDVVDRIRKVKTGTQQGYQDVPVEPVIIEKAVISES